MKRDFLTGELGLSKEQTDKIMAQYGESVNSLKEENKRLTEENEAFSQKAQGADELHTQVTELTERVGKLTSELKSSQINGAVSQALLSAGAKNLKAAGALIDIDKISFEDDGVKGLTEQVEQIKKDCGYLFYDDSYASGMRHRSSADINDGFTSYARAAAKLN